MRQRITIMIDNNLVKNLRLIQSKQIATSQRSVSFSDIVNQMLKKGLKS